MPVRTALGALALAALAACGPCAAESAWPFAGRWLMEGETCGAAGRPEDLVLTVTAKTLAYYASTCAIAARRRLSASGDPVSRLRLRCTGEDNTSDSRDVVLTLLEKTDQRNDLLLVIDMADWSIARYKRCEK